MQVIPGEGPIRVLFLSDPPGTPLSADTFFPKLTKALGHDAIYFDYLRSPAVALSDYEYLSKFDVVLWFNGHDRLEQKEAINLKKFVARGKGLLLLGDTVAYPQFTDYLESGVPISKPNLQRGQVLPVDAEHPFLRSKIGEAPKWLIDGSGSDSLSSIIQEFVPSDGEEVRLSWTGLSKVGQGRVAYSGYGNDAVTWSDSSYQQLIRNAILWLSGKERVERWWSFIESRKPLRYEPRTDIPNFEGVPGGFQFQFPMNAEDSLSYFQIPVGFRLELFASEPDIMNPIYMDWDERGRLWVVQSVDYPHYMKKDQIGNDSIRILEDTDGDGRCDKITLFADKLNLPTSFTFSNGGIIVAQAPYFLFLKDTDGDDRADIREIVMDGWGTTDTHAGPSNLQYGLDNWIWGAVGYSGYSGSERFIETFGNGVYRFRSDYTDLEFLYQCSNNTWGLGLNEAGDAYGGGANGAPSYFGYLPVTSLAKEGQSAKMVAKNRMLASITTNIRQTNNFGNFSGATGHFFASSDRFPEEWRGKTFFIGGTTGHVVNRFTEVRDGAGYISQNEFSMLASADEWVSPSCVRVGPDGVLWILDWYNFILQHNPIATTDVGGYNAIKGEGNAHINPNRDNTRGRIYRMVWEKDYSPKTKSLEDASAEQLVEALDDDNQFWRLTAQRLLVQTKQVQAVESLEIRLKSPGVGAIHAFWALHGLGKLSDDLLVLSLNSVDASMRRNAIKALSEDESGLNIILRKDVSVFLDSDPHNLRTLYNKIAVLPSSERLTERLREIRFDENSSPELLAALKNMLVRHPISAEGAIKSEFDVAAGDVEEGRIIALQHPFVSCRICHKLSSDDGYRGADMGPPLEGIATRKSSDYILESLLKPNASIAEGYEHFKGASPMPALSTVLSDKEISDLMAYLLTLK
ncbi:PVC-type heme-binding CxxCH protein [Pelagicoccus sp. SDUM812002]|uniref:PVC-type heme-binding CxxCH protein n=1 Tax=Pelagicoccus sp. SDUM812002 TaxID=3041266 RepID=UPI00280D04AE|nr:PVC-type heme-binding CxxCH protein [Pelagicoccus sp. SDUM812002]MDQ8184198.1 ThuA domain-containing protein [Pelagicoccus sp. SDUM812002]